MAYCNMGQDEKGLNEIVPCEIGIQKDLCNWDPAKMKVYNGPVWVIFVCTHSEWKSKKIDLPAWQDNGYCGI